MLRPWKLEIQLDYQSDKAIYLQIADAVIEDIQSGRLKKERLCQAVVNWHRI